MSQQVQNSPIIEGSDSNAKGMSQQTPSEHIPLSVSASEDEQNPFSDEDQCTSSHEDQCTSSLRSRKRKEMADWSFDETTCRKELAKMIIVDEKPFGLVEREGFREFMATLCPGFQLPSRSTVIKDCIDVYIDEKRKLKSKLKDLSQRVSLTTDIWASEQGTNYMCVTAHYIDDDWKLNKKLLDFCPISDHKGDTIGRTIEQSLLDWGIDKVFCVSVDNISSFFFDEYIDNASSSEVAMNYLRDRLSSWGTNLLGGKYLHMRCVTRIINLIVSEGLKEIDSSIARVRAVVGCIRQCPARMQRFQECMDREKMESKKLLYLDVPTMWNSTFFMLAEALMYAKAIDLFGRMECQHESEFECDHGGVPSEEDWKKVGTFVKFLKIFYDLTLKISGSLHVTSNTIVHQLFGVKLRIQKWELNDDESLSSMAKGMRERFDKYYGSIEEMNMVVYFAIILDPRYKMEFLDWLFSKLHINKGAFIKNAMHEFYQEYKRTYSPSAPSSAPLSAPLSSSTSLIALCNSDIDCPFEEEYWRHKAEKSGSVDTKSELDKYLAEDCEPNSPNFDILVWWKQNDNRYRFPILSTMARDVLAVPVSTLPSESVFSMEGRILDTFRSSLTPKTAQALICVRDWLCSPDCYALPARESSTSFLDV